MTISRQTIDMPQPMYDTADKAVFSSSEISLKNKQQQNNIIHIINISNFL